MQYSHRAITGLTVPVGLSLVLALASPASAQQHYERVNLVSDIAGVALRKDPNLVDPPNLINPWGVAFSPTGLFWISDNGTGVATLYNGDGKPQSLVVTIPPPSSPGKSAPTGQVFNNSSGFMISNKDTGKSGPSFFIFATEDGTISGWNPNVNPTSAILAVDNSGSAVYKGLAISVGTKPSETFIYATNFHSGFIEKYESMNFTKVGSFTDSSAGSGFAPFGIQNIKGQLYVTYAKKQDNSEDDESGSGNGFIDVFDTDGNLVKRFASGTTVDHNGLKELNSPWGLALAPQNFGQFSGALLVGNFGDGRINAFDLNGTFLGQLHDQIGQPLAINGLWALVFGNGHQAGARNSLFFTAGIGDEGHGLFGVIRAREDQNKNDEHQDEYGENLDVMNY